MMKDARINGAGERVTTYPAWGVVHGKSIPRFNMKEFFFFPIVQIGQYFRQSSGGVQTFTTTTGGVIFPIVMPHGLPPVLKRLHTPHYAYCHDFDYRQSGFGH